MTEHESSERRETEPQLRPRVWLADPDDETDGIWVDATSSVREILERNDNRTRVLDLHDFGSFRLRLDDDLAAVVRVANGISRYGLAFAAWAEFHDADPGMCDRFSEHYVAHFASLKEFGQNLIGASRRDVAAHLPEDIAPYVQIDYQAIAEDELRSPRLLDLPDPEGGFWLFWGADGAPESRTSEANDASGG